MEGRKMEGVRVGRECERQKQRWREKMRGWKQLIWKREDRKTLWQAGIMRFGSLCGFPFTCKRINIKNTHYSPFCSHLFKPSSQHIHPLPLSDFSIWRINHQTVYCKGSLFTWFKSSGTKLCPKCAIWPYVPSQTGELRSSAGCWWMSFRQMLFWFNLPLYGLSFSDTAVSFFGRNKCEWILAQDNLSAFAFVQKRTETQTLQ